jgi:hypothetical protein
MADFRYVTRDEVREERMDIIDLIRDVADYVRDDFTFQFNFIGSSARNMITYDADSNIGYDFDVNIYVNDPDEEYTPGEIRTKIFDALQSVAPKYGYQKIENSTSVITIKMVDYLNSRICHSCDFAVVYDCEDGQQQYIRLNKATYQYQWAYRGKGYEAQTKKIEWLKKNGLWNEVRDYYLYKKDSNDNPDKHSRAIFAETINEMCKKHKYN